MRLYSPVCLFVLCGIALVSGKKRDENLRSDATFVVTQEEDGRRKSSSSPSPMMASLDEVAALAAQKLLEPLASAMKATQKSVPPPQEVPSKPRSNRKKSTDDDAPTVYTPQAYPAGMGVKFPNIDVLDNLNIVENILSNHGMRKGSRQLYASPEYIEDPRQLQEEHLSPEEIQDPQTEESVDVADAALSNEELLEAVAAATGVSKQDLLALMESAQIGEDDDAAVIEDEDYEEDGMNGMEFADDHREGPSVAVGEPVYDADDQCYQRYRVEGPTPTEMAVPCGYESLYGVENSGGLLQGRGRSSAGISMLLSDRVVRQRLEELGVLSNGFLSGDVVQGLHAGGQAMDGGDDAVCSYPLTPTTASQCDLNRMIGLLEGLSTRSGRRAFGRNGGLLSQRRRDGRMCSENVEASDYECEASTKHRRGRKFGNRRHKRQRQQNCDEGKVFTRGRCRSAQPSRFFCPDSVGNAIVPVGSPALPYCEPSMLSNICPEGFELVGSECVAEFPPILTCPEGTLLVEGSCIPHLPPPPPMIEPSAPMISSPCPRDFFLHDGVSCVPRGPAQYRRRRPSASCPSQSIPLGPEDCAAEGAAATCPFDRSGRLLCGRVVPSRKGCPTGFLLKPRQEGGRWLGGGIMSRGGDDWICEKVEHREPRAIKCHRGFKFDPESGLCVQRRTVKPSDVCDEGRLDRNRRMCSRLEADVPHYDCPTGYDLVFEDDEERRRVGLLGGGSRRNKRAFKCRRRGGRALSEIEGAGNVTESSEIIVGASAECTDGMELHPTDAGELCLRTVPTGAPKLRCVGRDVTLPTGGCLRTVRQRPTFDFTRRCSMERELCALPPAEVQPVMETCPENSTPLRRGGLRSLGGGGCLQRLRVSVPPPPQPQSFPAAGFCPDNALLTVSFSGEQICQIREAADIPQACIPHSAPMCMDGAPAVVGCPAGYDLECGVCVVEA